MVHMEQPKSEEEESETKPKLRTSEIVIISLFSGMLVGYLLGGYVLWQLSH